MKAKLKKNNIIVILYVFLFFSCKVDNAFYFDIASQTICSCEKSFYKLSIDNDSVASNGSQYEGGILLVWNDTVNPPPRGTSSELCHWLHFFRSMRNAGGQTGAVFLLVKSGWARCPA